MPQYYCRSFDWNPQNSTAPLPTCTLDGTQTIEAYNNVRTSYRTSTAALTRHEYVTVVPVTVHKLFPSKRTATPMRFERQEAQFLYFTLFWSQATAG